MRDDGLSDEGGLGSSVSFGFSGGSGRLLPDFRPQLLGSRRVATVPAAPSHEDGRSLDLHRTGRIAQGDGLRSGGRPAPAGGSGRRNAMGIRQRVPGTGRQTARSQPASTGPGVSRLLASCQLGLASWKGRRPGMLVASPARPWQSSVLPPDHRTGRGTEQKSEQGALNRCGRSWTWLVPFGGSGGLFRHTSDGPDGRHEGRKRRGL